jgi:hypothetical protein
VDRQYRLSEYASLFQPTEILGLDSGTSIASPSNASLSTIWQVSRLFGRTSMQPDSISRSWALGSAVHGDKA